MKRVLFVCTGNTCRSPLAAALLARLAGLWQIPGLVTASAGLSAFPDDPASAQAIAVGRELGVDLSGHRSRPVTPSLARGSDLLAGMTRAHVAALRRAAPSARVVLLGDGIDDPFGGDIAAYRACAAQMIMGLQPLLAMLGEPAQ